MAGYRQFHTKFWKDEWLIELDPLERYLFSYLFTNELSSISGIYKLPLRVIINETGLEKQFVEMTLTKFQDAKKIFYKDGVMWVVNMFNHHKNASPLTMKKVDADVEMVGDCDVKKAYLHHRMTGEYCIDTVSILTSQRKRKSESEREKGDIPTSPASLPNERALTPETIVTKIYMGVTGMMALPGDGQDKADLIYQFWRDKKTIAAATAFLKPYFDRWCSTRGKNGRTYSKTGMGWLDWALAGELPGSGGSNGHRPPIEGV